MVRRIRDLVSRLINCCGDIDDRVNVKICRRDEEGVVTHVAILPVVRVDAHDNICVEETDIYWREYK